VEVDYEYRGLKASTWDLIRGDTSAWDDRLFYRGVIGRSGQPALDVGCGTGRLLLDYLAAGVDIDGVDNSPEMLALCREKAGQLGLQPCLFQQSMERLELPRLYRTIIVPSSSFQLLIDPQDAAETMRRFFRHLASRGTLVMPFMILYTGQATGDVVTRDWRRTAEKVRPEDGAVVRIWSRNIFDLVEQLEHTEDRFEVIRDGQVIATELHSRSPATRWYTQDQAVALYKAAGFTNVCLVSGFSHQPVRADDTLFCVFGTKP
jgi:ubiquinone/menaquinone biosynthesis C-methylase UbiE